MWRHFSCEALTRVVHLAYALHGSYIREESNDMAGGDGVRSRETDEPLYNIKAVFQRTGVPADTMRA